MVDKYMKVFEKHVTEYKEQQQQALVRSQQQQEQFQRPPDGYAQPQPQSQQQQHQIAPTPQIPHPVHQMLQPEPQPHPLPMTAPPSQEQHAMAPSPLHGQGSYSSMPHPHNSGPSSTIPTSTPLDTLLEPPTAAFPHVSPQESVQLNRTTLEAPVPATEDVEMKDDTGNVAPVAELHTVDHETGESTALSEEKTPTEPGTAMEVDVPDVSSAAPESGVDAAEGMAMTESPGVDTRASESAPNVAVDTPVRAEEAAEESVLPGAVEESLLPGAVEESLLPGAVEESVTVTAAESLSELISADTSPAVPVAAVDSIETTEVTLTEVTKIVTDMSETAAVIADTR